MRALSKVPNKRHRRLQLMVGLAILCGVGVFMVLTRSKSFADRLQDEVTNRAFARVSMMRAVTKPAPPDVLAFWRAYRDLEVLNLKKYQPIAEKYELEPQEFVVTLKVHAAGLLVALFPERMLEGLTRATAEYVGELRILRDLAPEEDQEFFDYAVAQEQAQATALHHANADRFDLAAEVLRRFVEENT